MPILLRLVSAGGWLANMLNQASGTRGPNVGHDESVQPRMLWVWVGALLLLAVIFGVDLRSHPNPAAAAIAILSTFLAVLVHAGWRAGLVPFAPDDSRAWQVPKPATGTGIAAPNEPVPVRVTGVVEDEERRLRRYRHRPARLVGGRLKVAGPGSAAIGEQTRVRPDFGLEAIANPVGGTAWLVSGGRPALRLERHAGPVVLAFDDAVVRDRILECIEDGAWPARPDDDADADD